MNITNKLNRFVDNTQGQFQEVSDKNNVWQCMDLAYEWIFCLDIPKATIQHTYAYEVFTKPTDLTRQYFEIIPNSPDFIPQDGDIVVYKGGEAGHIAIALGGGSKTKFLQYEQNKPLGTNAHIANCLGFLRPKIEIDEDQEKALALLIDYKDGKSSELEDQKHSNLEGAVSALLGAARDLKTKLVEIGSLKTNLKTDETLIAEINEINKSLKGQVGEVINKLGVSEIEDALGKIGGLLTVKTDLETAQRVNESLKEQIAVLQASGEVVTQFKLLGLLFRVYKSEVK
jgi:hypothetical protein